MSTSTFILDPYFGELFSSYTPAQQAAHIDSLRTLMDKIQSGDAHARREMGIMSHPEDGEEDAEDEVRVALAQCSWQMAQLLRFSSPPRLAEAEPYLRTALAHAPNDTDPTLYLAVVLSLTPARGEEALATYNAVINVSGNVYTNAWAGAALARMLRRTGRTTEAQALETRAVAALDGLPPASVRMLLSDNVAILEHPAVRALLNPEPAPTAGAGVPLRRSTAVTA
ncbi:hypothetical protein PENSPDRAFT_759037 [Peniophora sp. CONT]|nr:hypothetical protein PENSPDRAFT_759037 [Peniophora sp. CONT]